ncbi:MAG: flagellar biosynthetic protein FliR [Deltaproteobacteria bacterium]|nr:flagellar biosynthetic protein FliR [Deltaproteobacteria bacterium]
MNIPVIDEQFAAAFLLIFLRMSAMIAMIPVFGDRTVPARVKGAMALILSMLVFPFVRAEISPIGSFEILSLAVSMTGEVLIGLIIGLMARFVFAGVQFAGELVGLQMGFAIANIIDPITSTQVSIIAEFQYLFAMLIFLLVDAHHIFLLAIVDSFRIIHPLAFQLSGPLMDTMLGYSRDIFIVAVKVSAPIVAALIFINVGLGIIARTVPQINVFIVGFPLQIAAGLFFIGLTVPVFFKVLERYFFNYAREIGTLLHLM